MEIRYISLFSFWNLVIFKFGGKLFSKKKKKILVASLFLLQFEFSLRDYYTQFFFNSNPNLSP